MQQLTGISKTLQNSIRCILPNIFLANHMPFTLRLSMINTVVRLPEKRSTHAHTHVNYPYYYSSPLPSHTPLTLTSSLPYPRDHLHSVCELCHPFLTSSPSKE